MCGLPLVISKRPGPVARFGHGSARWALTRSKPEKPKPGPSPLKGGPGRGLHFRPGPSWWAGPNHGLLGPPRSLPIGPSRSPPRGPPRSPFRSPPKSPFISPPRGPSKSPLKTHLKAQPLYIGFLFKLYSKVK